MTTTPEELMDLVRSAVAAFERLTPEQQAAHLRAQAESWVRGEMYLVRKEMEETRRFLDSRARLTGAEAADLGERIARLQPEPQAAPTRRALTIHEWNVLVRLVLACSDVARVACEVVLSGKGTSSSTLVGSEYNKLHAIAKLASDADLLDSATSNKSTEKELQTRKP